MDNIEHIHLNVTVESVGIQHESDAEKYDQPIIIQGDSHFDVVTIHSSRNIQWNMKGSTRILLHNTGYYTIQFGERSKIDYLALRSGVTVEDVVVDYQQVKQWIGKITPEAHDFVATIERQTNHLGTIEYRNAGSYEVYYYKEIARGNRFIPWPEYQVHPFHYAGDTLPEGAVRYQDGDLLDIEINQYSYDIYLVDPKTKEIKEVIVDMWQQDYFVPWYKTKMYR